MQNDFSFIERRILQSLVKTSSAEDIALVLDKPLHQVKEKIASFITGNNVIPYMKKAKRRLERSVERKKRLEPQYATRSIDYSELISVKIDNKTVVLVKPGTNIEALKKKYLKKINAWKEVPEPGYKYVKKFKPVE